MMHFGYISVIAWGKRQKEDPHMKRMLVLLLLLAFLVACVPTPEKDYIVNRAEEQKPAEVDAAPDAVPIPVPAHASMTADPTEHVTVVVDADVRFDADAPHPMIEVEALDLTRDDAAFSAFLELVASGATLYREWPETKDYVGALMQEAIQYDDRLGDLVSIDQSFLDLLEVRYKNAPESPEKVPVDRPEAGGRYYIERPDGMISRICINFEPNSLDYCRDIREDYYEATMLEPGSPVVLTDPEISEADARAKAEAFMKAFGAECDCLVETKRGFSIRYFTLSETLWAFTFVRSFNGTPSIERPGSYQTALDTPSSVGAPWSIESATLFVGKDGVVSAKFWGLSTAKRVAVKNAQLCDFDQALDMGVRQIGYLHDGAMDKPHHTYTVTNVNLCYGMQAKKDDLSVGVYQPMWELVYVDADNPDEQPKKLYVSALTGGHVEPRETVQHLMQRGT